jgi:sugar phosphate permease
VGRQLFCGGLLLAGIATLAFGYTSSLHVLQLLWFCNGIAQGVGWPALAKIVLDTFPKENMGTIWSVMNMSGNVGYMLSPAVYLYVSSVYSWRAAFLLAGGASIVCALLVYPTLPATTTSSAPTTTTTASAQSASPTPDAAERKRSSFVLYSWVLIQNPAFVLLCCSDFCTYFAIKAMNDWMTLYVNESWLLPVSFAAGLVFWTELGGVLGALLCGPISDSIRGHRALTSVLFSIGGIIALQWIRSGPASTKSSFAEGEVADGSIGAYILLVTSVGFFLNAPKTLSGIAVKDVTSSEMRGTAVGLLGLAGQAGAYFSGAPLGFLLEKHGWYVFANSLVLCSALSAAAMLAVHTIQRRMAAEKKNA